MVRVVGIDPGTGSWDLLGLEDGSIFLDISLPSKTILDDPNILIDILKKHEPLDTIVAPSGHGIPLKPLKNITEEEIQKANLRKNKDPSLMGLGKVLRILKKNSIEGYVIPGVKQLKTVKNYLKYNKIDMGTADKVCCVAASIVDQARTLNIQYKSTGFILVEVGFGFNATIAVENGKIIDGIGGSVGSMGFRSAGGMDGEIAYLLDHVSKNVIYSGGLSTIVGYEDLSPRELLLMAKKDKKIADALDGFLNGILKNVFALIPSFSSTQNIKEILISGRVSEDIKRMLASRIPKDYDIPIRTVNSIARISKIAAQGAAMLADGLANGQYNDLVEVMDLKSSDFDLLGNIFIGKIEIGR